MIVALSYDHASQDQTRRLVDWLARIGKYRQHTLILAVESRVTLDVTADLMPLFGDVEQFEYSDPYEHFPESKNLAFQQCAGVIAAKYLGKFPRWLYLEPDAVPTRGTFIDEIQTESTLTDLPFCGCLVPANNRFATPAHMASVGVYPVDMVKAGAGAALNAHETPFQAEIADVVLNGRLFQSQIICHDLDGTAIRTGAATGCALYHPDRDGRYLAKMMAPETVYGTAEGSEDALAVIAANPTQARPAPPPPGPFSTFEPTAEPWKNRVASEQHIKDLVEELKRFCTDPPHKAFIRAVLQAWHVTPIMGQKKYFRKPRLKGVDLGTKRAIAEQARRAKFKTVGNPPP